MTKNHNGSRPDILVEFCKSIRKVTYRQFVASVQASPSEKQNRWGFRMKKIALLLSLSLSTVAFADGAVHISKFDCGVLDGQKALVITKDSKVTITPPVAGVTILKCMAHKIANSTGHSVQWTKANTGLMCNTQMGTTDDWHETVSSSGHAMLTCKVHH